jgi:hypothetical protein
MTLSVNHTLVLNILRGLNKRYDNLKFHDVHNNLFLKKITMCPESAFNSTTTFAASDGRQY